LQHKRLTPGAGHDGERAHRLHAFATLTSAVKEWSAMLGTNWRVRLLSVAGMVEGITALGLMIVPRVVVWLLFGTDIDAAAVALARVAGIALLSLSLGCWMGRREAGVQTESLAAMLAYNILVTPYLFYLGIAGQDGPGFKGLPRQAPRRDGWLVIQGRKDQTYALCAAARCNVYDGVAYCQCEEKRGDSISLPFPIGKGEDVCSINAAGANNKYMVSTYSLPEQIISPQGGSAAYTCASETSNGAYAQCDGGLCFRSTEETIFPGFDEPVPKGQIICSCPITEAKPGTSTAGY
jgi:hypothetical protein